MYIEQKDLLSGMGKDADISLSYGTGQILESADTP